MSPGVFTVSFVCSTNPGGSASPRVMAQAGIRCASAALRTDFACFAVSEGVAVSRLFCPDLSDTCFACTLIQWLPLLLLLPGTLHFSFIVQYRAIFFL